VRKMNLTAGGQGLKILCLGAHSDDIEIGCGGSVLQLIQDHPHMSFHWIVFSANEKRREEAHQSAEAFLTGADRRSVTVNKFKDGYFPYQGGEIKDFFEEMKRGQEPDLIFTHHRLDGHQDHRLISELTWNTFRDHVVFEYEIPKYDGDLGAPDTFIHLDEAICARKIEYILKYFKTQSANQWFAEETFRSILRLRGVESNSPSRYAEGFYGRKLIIS
jgi:LmbE family N-acetylglucosaminyl deacetylase